MAAKGKAPMYAKQWYDTQNVRLAGRRKDECESGDDAPSFVLPDLAHYMYFQVTYLEYILDKVDASPVILLYGRKACGDHDSVCARVTGFLPHMSLLVPEWRRTPLSDRALGALAKVFADKLVREEDRKWKARYARTHDQPIDTLVTPWEAYERQLKAERRSRVRRYMAAQGMKRSRTADGEWQQPWDSEDEEELADMVGEESDEDEQESDSDGDEEGEGGDGDFSHGAPARVDWRDWPQHRRRPPRTWGRQDDVQRPEQAPPHKLVVRVEQFQGYVVDTYGDGEPDYFLRIILRYPALVPTLRRIMGAYNGVRETERDFGDDDDTKPDKEPAVRPDGTTCMGTVAIDSLFRGAAREVLEARRNLADVERRAGETQAVEDGSRNWFVDALLHVDGDAFSSVTMQPSCMLPFEADIDFTLRYMLDCNMASGLPVVRVPILNIRREEKRKDYVTRCDDEFVVSYQRVECVYGCHDGRDLDALKGHQPTLVVASFDAEMETSETSGFPEPATRAKCHCGRSTKCTCNLIRVIQVGVTLARYDGARRTATACHMFIVGDGTEPRLLRHPTDKGAPPVHVWAYRSECEMLVAWRSFIIVADPDVLMGYNINNFDWRFIFARADQLGIGADMARGFGRRKWHRTVMRKKASSSRAKGYHQVWEGNFTGRWVDDLFQAFKQSKLPLLSGRVRPRGNKLNDMCAYYLEEGVQKIEVDPKQMAHKQRTVEGRAQVALYCAYDTYLPIRVYDAIARLPTLVENARLIGLQGKDILTRGVSLWVMSNMMRDAKKPGQPLFMFPYISDRTAALEAAAGYKGATVLEPERGFYGTPDGALGPEADGPTDVLDFAALYPSIMRGHNLGPDTLLTRSEALKLGYAREAEDGTLEPDSSKVHDWGNGHLFLDKSVRTSITVTLLEKLVASRKVIKRLMAAEENPYKKSMLDAAQAARKVVANSFYGLFGAVFGRLPCIPVAATVTFIGRKMIDQTKGMIEARFQRKHGWSHDVKIKYGDSAAADTALLLRNPEGEIVIELISEFYARFEGGKDRGDGGMRVQPVGNWEVWSEGGWTRVHYVMEHETTKHMWRVNTHTGCVDVTEDHSLLRRDGTDVVPKDVALGDELLHFEGFPEVFTPDAEGDYALGYFYGAFFADGSSKRVPPCVLNGSQRLRTGFFDGYYAGDGDKDARAAGCGRFDIKGQAGALGLLSLGFAVSINTRLDKPDIYRMTLSSSTSGNGQKRQRKAPFAIKKLVDLGPVSSGTRVYDLETESHHFAAGVGRLVIHNTDSVMPHLNHPVPGLDLGDARVAILLGSVMSEYVTRSLPPPNELEMEKCMKRWCLYQKKRYAACVVEGKIVDKDWLRHISNTVNWLLEHEETAAVPDDVFPLRSQVIDGGRIGDIVKLKEATYMARGVESVRRDAPPLAERVLTRVMNMVLMEGDVPGALATVCAEIERTMLGQQSMADLTMSAQFSRPLAQYKTTPPHIQVVQRMQKREREGDDIPAPAVGDRVPYVITHADKRARKGDRAEHPAYMARMGLTADGPWYVAKQLEPQLRRLLGPVLSAEQMRELFSGEHMRKRRIVNTVAELQAHTSAAAGSASAWRKFAQADQCLKCQRYMVRLPAAAICDECLMLPGGIADAVRAFKRARETGDAAVLARYELL